MTAPRSRCWPLKNHDCVGCLDDQTCIVVLALQRDVLAEQDIDRIGGHLTMEIGPRVTAASTWEQPKAAKQPEGYRQLIKAHRRGRRPDHPLELLRFGNANGLLLAATPEPTHRGHLHAVCCAASRSIFPSDRWQGGSGALAR